jgi:glycosyltransferase involved in cell wall biosynthesis
LRIVLDLLADPEKGTGVSRYARNLVNNLAEVDHTNEYLLILNRESEGKYRVKAPNFKYKTVRCTFGSPALIRMYELFVLPLYLFFFYRADIVHSVNNVLPLLLPRFKKIVTIHDVLFMKHKDRYGGIKQVFYRLLVALSARNADIIITDSESSKKDIISYLKIDESKISVIDLGCDEFIPNIPEGRIDNVKGKYGIRSPYILTVGNLDPLKNIKTAILAFADYLRSYKDKDVVLVVAGNKERMFMELEKIVSNRGLTGKVVFTGYVPEEDLKALYKGAAVFLFLSLSEGYGLPPLEAMAAGIPVIASGVEPVAGIVSSQILVDPLDISEVSESIHKVLSDKNISRPMIEKGRKEASSHLWPECAVKTHEIYNMLSHDDGII